MSNIRAMLLELKVPNYLTEMVIPFMFFRPGTVDPDSASVIEIIKGVQQGLQRLGYGNVEPSGILDSDTAEALDDIIEPSGSWLETPWIDIYGNIITALKNPARKAHRMRYRQPKEMGQYFTYRGTPPGPLPGRIPGPLGMGAVSLDSGVALEFGQGVRNKSIIVPIPKNSGATYNAFKNLQRQINRLLSKKEKRIDEDGIIGQSTYNGLQTAQEVIGISVPGDENTIEMAKHAVTIAHILTERADALGISADANKGRVLTLASAVEVTAGPMTPVQEAAFTKSASTSSAIKKYLPFLLLSGGVAWYAASQRKRKKRGPNA
jgi:hypothetical protein